MDLAQAEALSALLLLLFFELATGSLEGADLGRQSGLASRPVTLVGGRARRTRRNHEHAAVFSRVVDPHRLLVFIFGHELLTSEEEGVLPVTADRQKA